MALFVGGKEVEVVLFSPLEGKLTVEGKPATGARIDLWIKWKDQEGETFSYTADNEGNFSIPEHKAAYKQKALVQLVVVQKVHVNYNDKDYIVWNLSKMNKDRFSELGGEPINVRCEITNELETIRTNGSLGGIACTWDRLRN